MRPNILFALAPTLSMCKFQFNCRSAVTPKSLNSLTSSKTELSKNQNLVKGCFFFVIRIILHFFTLKSIKLGELHWWRLLRSSSKKFWSEAESIILELLQSSCIMRWYFQEVQPQELWIWQRTVDLKGSLVGLLKKLLTKRKRPRPAPLLVADGLDSFRTIVRKIQRYRDHRASAIKFGY